MAKPYLFYDDLVTGASDGGYVTKPRLSQLSAVFLLSVCVVANQRNLWSNPLDFVDDAEWLNIQALIRDAESELLVTFAIGSLITSITDLDSYTSLLRMDGQTVAQDDYPELTDAVPAGWLAGDDIVLPDMDNQSLHGDYGNVGDTIGENDVTLQTSDMPSHTHIQSPHTHLYTSPLVTPTGAGPIVAAASVVIPTPLATGLATPTNQNTGGDGSHNNIPESMAVIYYIVAK